jgi:signal transduction histidine kinase
VTVRLTQDLDTLTFVVTDDGVGFDTAETTSGTGLQGIVDRLDTVNGAITIESAPGEGTVVTGTVPITATSQGGAVPTLAGANR